MRGLDIIGAADSGPAATFTAQMARAGVPGFATFAPEAAQPAPTKKPSKLEGASWFKRPVLGPVPGWGVATGVGALTGIFLYLAWGK